MGSAKQDNTTNGTQDIFLAFSRWVVAAEDCISTFETTQAINDKKFLDVQLLDDARFTSC